MGDSWTNPRSIQLNQLVGRNGQSSLIGDASSRKKAILSKREDLKKETDRTKAELEEKIKIIEDVVSVIVNITCFLHSFICARITYRIEQRSDPEIRRKVKVIDLIEPCDLLVLKNNERNWMIYSESFVMMKWNIPALANEAHGAWIALEERRAAR